MPVLVLPSCCLTYSKLRQPYQRFAKHFIYEEKNSYKEVCTKGNLRKIDNFLLLFIKMKNLGYEIGITCICIYVIREGIRSISQKKRVGPPLGARKFPPLLIGI